MRFAVRANDRIVRELVVVLFEDGDSYAATWRAVGKALREAGYHGPSYELVRKLARLEERRREARRQVRRARREVAEAFFLSSLVVRTPQALGRLRDAKLEEELVTQWHEASFDDDAPP